MNKNRQRQRGAHLAEFAIVGLIFFVMLIAVIEFGRLLYAWQALDEVSRRAARLATVCPVGSEAVKQAAVFNAPGTAGGSPLLSGLSDANVVIDYLDQSGTVIDPATNYDDIRFVRASIHGYTHTLLIPLFVNSFELPDVTTVLPRESLGVWPGGTGCLGTYM